MAKKTTASEDAEADTSVQGETTSAAETPEQRMTPRQWADSLFPRSSTGRVNPERWKHGAAAALHLWSDHEHHTGRPIEITRAEYQGALDAACKPNPAPHPAALGRHAREA